MQNDTSNPKGTPKLASMGKVIVTANRPSQHCPNCEALAAEIERLRRECREQRLTLIAAVVASGGKIVISMIDAMRAPDYELRKSHDPSNCAFILTAALQETKP